MDFGISTTLLLGAGENLHPADAIDILGRGGFNRIDYNFQTDATGNSAVGIPPLCGDNWRAFYQQIRERADAVGVRIHQTHGLTYNYFAFSDETRRLNMLLDRTIEATRILGASVIVLHPIAPIGAEDNDEAARTANALFFREKALHAESLGIRIAIENMISTWMRSGEVIKRYCTDSLKLLSLVEAVNCANVGVCLDIGHLHYMGEDEVSAILRCKERLVAVHMHDNDQVNDEHLTPFCGTVPWSEVCNALYKARFRGVFSLEIHRAVKGMPSGLRDETITYIRNVGQYLSVLASQDKESPAIPETIVF